MAWNPSPQVKVARDFAKKFGADRVVIIYIQPDGKMGYASYGADSHLCYKAKQWGDVLYERTERGYETGELAP